MHIVPGDDLKVQLDAGVLLLELVHEVGAVHAGAQEPLLGVGTVLADDDVQRDLIRSRGFRGGSFRGGGFRGLLRSLTAGGKREDHDDCKQKR